eukprot:11633666-Heterocapsa_arctica.AAC.1
MDGEGEASTATAHRRRGLEYVDESVVCSLSVVGTWDVDLPRKPRAFQEPRFSSCFRVESLF